MEDKTGGPAFPQTKTTYMDGELVGVAHDPGMSLRDFFAAAALTGSAQVESKPRDIAEFCYEMADAMLAAKSRAEKKAGEL